MTRYHLRYIGLILVSVVLAYLFVPWVGSLPFLLLFLLGALTVFGIRQQIVEHLSCSSDLGASITIGIVETLVSSSDENRSAALPAFITIGKNGRDLRDLYNQPGFKMLCEVVRLIGPVPVFPPCALMSGPRK